MLCLKTNFVPTVAHVFSLPTYLERRDGDFVIWKLINFLSQGLWFLTKPSFHIPLICKIPKLSRMILLLFLLWGNLCGFFQPFLEFGSINKGECLTDQSRRSFLVQTSKNKPRPTTCWPISSWRQSRQRPCLAWVSCYKPSISSSLEQHLHTRPIFPLQSSLAWNGHNFKASRLWCFFAPDSLLAFDIRRSRRNKKVSLLHFMNIPFFFCSVHFIGSLGYIPLSFVPFCELL